MEVLTWFMLLFFSVVAVYAFIKRAEQEREQYMEEQYFAERNYERR